MRISRPLYKYVSHAVTDNRPDLNPGLFFFSAVFIFLPERRWKNHEPGAKTWVQGNGFSTRTDQGSYTFFIWHLVSTKILQITGKADDDPRVVVFFYHSFDQVRVGVPTAWADLLYKSHILHACRIKLNDEVEDFYNSHCGWTSTGVLPCLNTHTYILQTKRECFCIFFFNIVRGKAPRGRWFKEQSEQRRTQRCRMSKNTKGENSFLYV